MIKRLKYQEIDFEKYNRCIENSVQKKFYAERIFLDISTDKNWELLVYKDYEAVMPVPLIKKYGSQIVHNPKLCQQLGVFSKIDSLQINDLFYHFLTKNYAIRYYTFNDINALSESLITRKNFLIFPDKYETVRQKYSPKRKRKLRLDQEVLDNSEIVKNFDLETVKNFIRSTGLGADAKDLEEFINLLSKFYLNDKLDFYGFFYHQKLINMIAVYREKYSLALLGTFNDRNYVKLSGSSYLIDKVISENIETKIFDFEGSEVPAVEEFFRGFRPELRPYSCIQVSKKDLILKITKKLFFLN
ncbi:hypothetical protein [Epilithonimonas zeae]|uniref:hypothetical protein n=1 Tax=Epilithonimonas zeae TaxID=1416779 RepID=UPI00200D9512|nr:hypothetical protein [Epilithonimonas zeae]UQB69428.1 hypothetical protein KI430_03085 [Epilithonimonas zeae]